VRTGAKLALAGGCVALALTGAATALHGVYLPQGRSLPGTTLLHESQPPSVPLQRWLSTLQRKVAEREVTLDAGDSSVPVHLGELGLALDVDSTLQALHAHATRGSLFERLQRSWRAQHGQESVPAVFSFERSTAQQLLEQLAPGLQRDAVNARVDLRGHAKIADVPGRQLNVAATLERITALAEQDHPHLQLAFDAIAAEVPLTALIDVDVAQVLASFETDFKGHAGRRKVNIERAAKYLDGTVIGPGEIFSFNKTVGERSYKRGFVDAPVIVEDVMEPGIGGGVCQVATTVFAAAVYGNLEIVKRRSHSRPSGYAPLGLDATVIDHEVDLRIKNPYPVPILIHAFLPTETSIKVELLGHTLPVKVEHQYGVTERHDFVRRVKFTDEVQQPKRKQKGNYGYDVVSVVKIAAADGKTTRKSYSSTYYPVPEVYWVPPSFDLAQLPPLPEGASDTVIGDAPLPGQQENGENRVAEPPS
jgi:vancomycin resistance protein YoaR